MHVKATILKAFRFAALGAMALAAVALLGALRPTPAWAGYADIVIDASSGEVLHATNADTQNYPASLTKMMTLYLLFDALEKGKLKLDTPLPVSAHAAAQPATKIGLVEGSTIPVEKAILAVIIQSANDAAVVIGEGLGGSESDFAKQMTRKAQVLGMAGTTFKNASGLPDPGQKTTARDLVVLARALMTDFPQYYHYFSVLRFTWGGRVIKTHNHLMLAYEGADGLKTGYIRASGFNLVTSAVRGGQRVIGVVLGGKTPSARDQRMAKLLDGGFAELAMADSGGNHDTVLPGVKPADLGSAVETAMAQPAAGDTAGDAAADNDVAADATGEGDLDSADDNGTTPASSTVDSWAVQVGAFTRFEPARLAASNAQREYRGLVDARVLVDESTTSAGTIMYRSRLVGLSRAEADAACHGLKKIGTACLVIRVSTPVVAQGGAQ